MLGFFFWELTQFTVPTIIFSLMPWNNSHLCGPLLILCFRNIHIFFSHHRDSSRRVLVSFWTLSYSYTFSPANLYHYRVPELFRSYSFSYWHPLYPSHLSDFHAMWIVVSSDFPDEMMRHEHFLSGICHIHYWLAPLPGLTSNLAGGSLQSTERNKMLKVLFLL